MTNQYDIITANRALILQVVAKHYPNAVVDTFGGGYTDDDMFSSIKEGYFPEMDDLDYDNAYFTIGSDAHADDEEDGIVEEFNYNWRPSK